MEKFALTLQSQSAIDTYVADCFIPRNEKVILDEISNAITAGDLDTLNWFAGFGDGLCQILRNVKEYRKGLVFGFTDIVLNEYGWFASPKFLDREDIKLEQSEVRIGHGANSLWAYALSCRYGTAGRSGPLCVFCEPYPNRDAALIAALDEMKADMTKYVGNTDTSNYKQDVLVKTLKAIAAMRVDLVQLSLF